MKVSIIIPCYNEKNTIEKIIDKILLETQFEKEIIVIDDKSSDGTGELLKSIKHKFNTLILNPENCGKGYSIRKGIEISSGDIILIQDADLEYDPSDYRKLIKPITDNIADAVYGSRFISTEEKRVLFFWHSLGNRLLTLLSNMFTNLNLSDMETGYKVFRSESIKKITLNENRFGFEPEITAKIAKNKLRIYEVGIKYYGRQYSDGKKITWKDGLSAVRCIIKYNIFN